jgi:hypothetical protein
MNARAASPEVERAAVALLPEAADVARVLAEEQLPEPAGGQVRLRRLDRRLDDLWGGVDLADPDETVVGRDAHDAGVLRPVGDVAGGLVTTEDDGLDVGDLHSRS